MSFRIGQGYDVHKLIKDRPLVLGGVTVPYHKGLSGHSDADVLIHAVMDALLGAAGLGDIGRHFPDSDDRFKNISSVTLLSHTRALIENEGYMIVNVDAVVVAQHPKLAPYRDEMVRNIANTLCIGEGMVNIKAKTEEGLGFTGTGRGIAAHAVCLLEQRRCCPDTESSAI